MIQFIVGVVIGVIFTMMGIAVWVVLEEKTDKEKHGDIFKVREG